MVSDRIGAWDRATKREVPIIPGVDPLHDSKGSPWPGLKLEQFQVENLCTPEVSTTSFLATLCLSARSGAALGPPGNRTAVKPQDMVVAGPGKIPALQSSGEIQFLLLEMAPTYLMWAAEELAGGESVDFSQCWRFRDEQVRHIMLAMNHELLAGFPSGRLFGEYMGLSFRHLPAQQAFRYGAANRRLSGRSLAGQAPAGQGIRKRQSLQQA